MFVHYLVIIAIKNNFIYGGAMMINESNVTQLKNNKIVIICIYNRVSNRAIIIVHIGILNIQIYMRM